MIVNYIKTYGHQKINLWLKQMAAAAPSVSINVYYNDALGECAKTLPGSPDPEIMYINKKW